MSACAHDESTPHHHVDVAASVAASTRRSFTFAALALGTAAVLLLAAALLDPRGWVGALAAAAGWAVATAAASVTLVAAARHGTGRALVASAVVGALATVAAAWWLAAGGIHPVWATAGWAGAAALTQLGQSVAWDRTLRAPGPAGEYARDQAVHAAPERLPERLARWVVPAVAFGTWVWALGALPVAVVVIAPGAVLLQLVLARRGLSAARTR